MMRALLGASFVGAVIGAGVIGLLPTRVREPSGASAPKPREGTSSPELARPRLSAPEARSAAAKGAPGNGIRMSTTSQDGDPRALAEIQARRLQERARIDPQAAARAAGALPRPERRLAIASVIGIWSESAFSEAMEWACGLVDEEIRTEAMLALGYELARVRPAEAVQLAERLRRTPEVHALMMHALTQWAAMDPLAAARSSQGVADEPARHRMQAAVAQAWSEQDALSALAFTLEALPAGREQDLALAGISLRWAQRAPAEAAGLLESFPAGALRDTMLRDVVRIWSSRDPRAAETWLKGLRCDEMRSRGLQFLSDEGSGSTTPPAEPARARVAREPTHDPPPIQNDASPSRR